MMTGAVDGSGIGRPRFETLIKAGSEPSTGDGIVGALMRPVKVQLVMATGGFGRPEALTIVAAQLRPVASHAANVRPRSVTPGAMSEKHTLDVLPQQWMTDGAGAASVVMRPIARDSDDW